MTWHATSNPIFGFPTAAAAAALWRWCRACAQRRRQRHFLAQLDERGLRDIGITRCDAMREIDKPCWRA